MAKVVEFTDEQIADAIKRHIHNNPGRAYLNDGAFACSLGLGGVFLVQVQSALGGLICRGEIGKRRFRGEQKDGSDRSVVYWLPTPKLATN